MNRQNTVLIKQFPEHTRKTAQEIINMLFTWNGKEKSKLAGQPAQKHGSSTAKQHYQSDTKLWCCASWAYRLGDLETSQSAAHTEERPLSSSVGTDIPGHTYMERHLKKLSFARSSKSPRNVCELPGCPSAEVQQHRGQESKDRESPNPTHCLYRQHKRKLLKQPQLAGFHFQQSLVSTTLCQVYTVHSAQ